MANHFPFYYGLLMLVRLRNFFTKAPPKAPSSKTSSTSSSRVSTFSKAQLSSIIADLEDAPVDILSEGSQNYSLREIEELENISSSDKQLETLPGATYEDRLTDMETSLEIRTLIHRYWRLFDSSTLAKHDNKITKTQFQKIYSLIYIALHEAEGPTASVDGVREANGIWSLMMTDNSGFMGYPTFVSVMKHIVATWAVKSNEESYVEFLQILFSMISAVQVTYADGSVKQIPAPDAYRLRRNILMNMPLHLVEELNHIKDAVSTSGTWYSFNTVGHISEADFATITKNLESKQHLSGSQFYRLGEDSHAVLTRLNTVADSSELIPSIEHLEKAKPRKLELLQDRYRAMNQINPVLQTLPFEVRNELDKFGVSNFATMEIKQANMYYKSLYQNFVKSSGKNLKALAKKEMKQIMVELEKIGVHSFNLSRCDLYEAYQFSHADKLSTIALEMIDEATVWISQVLDDEDRMSEYIHELDYIFVGKATILDTQQQKPVNVLSEVRPPKITWAEK